MFSGLNCGLGPNKLTPDPRKTIATGCRSARWATHPQGSPSRTKLTFCWDHRHQENSPRSAVRYRGRISPIWAATRQLAIRFFFLRFPLAGSPSTWCSSSHLNAPRSNPSIWETKNKVQGLDRSGKSDLDPWLMWCLPNYWPHSPTHLNPLISFNLPFPSLCLPLFDFSLFGATRPTCPFGILRSMSFNYTDAIII